MTFVILLLPLCAFAAPTKLIKLNVLKIHKNSRIILSLNQPCKYHCFTLKKPSRVVIDLNKTKLACSLKHIKNVRVGIQPQQQLRLVFTLKQTIFPKTYILKPYGKFKYRLAIDLMPHKIKHTPPRPIHRATKTIKPVSNKELRNAMIIIDPGHGGKDPGATGQLGTHEKNVVLAISRDLTALLRKQPGINVKLTRTGDYFVPLRGRLRFARSGWADVFIAIHADAYKNSNARGASIFALSQHGASSEAARWLAQKENYSELMGGINLEDKSYLLRSVLIDLSQTATIRESLVLGNYITHSLNKVVRLHTGHVEQAPFMVLKSPDIPSLLVETGFLSNRYEEMLLRNPIYQQKVARALMQGIINYLHRRPPPGTILTILYRHSINHTVKPQETLTCIARSYATSVDVLKRLNHLTKNNLTIGQVVKIPTR